jgi:hypothetical protein
MTSATLDGKILELRLITKESTIGGASVFRIAKSLRDYNIAVSQNPKNSEQVQIAHEAFSRDILLYQLEMTKVSKALELCDDEISNYKYQEDVIEEKIKSTKSTLVALEQELHFQKSVRSFTEHCESEALAVNDLPTPHNLKRQIEDCDSTLASLTTSLGTVDANLHKRLKQYESLLQSIHILTSPIADDGDLGVARDAAEGDEADGDGDDDEEVDAKQDPDRRKSRGALELGKSEELDPDEEESEMQEEAGATVVVEDS